MRKILYCLITEGAEARGVNALVLRFNIVGRPFIQALQAKTLNFGGIFNCQIFFQS